MMRPTSRPTASGARPTRIIDQYGDAINILVSKHMDTALARRFSTTSLTAHRTPTEVITDRATFHDASQYENNRCECDHGRLKARLRPMRGLTTDRTASIVTGGHAFVQHLRRGHHKQGVVA